MARPEARRDLCFVATPHCVNDLLAKLINLRHVYCLDPCCGDGEALERAAPHGHRYGVELELDRAEQAGARMHKVAACAMQDARISRSTFGFCLLNPPYDDSTEGRLEMVFLERCSRYLMPSGILAYIIPDYRYDGKIRRFLRSHYDVLEHWRFPSGYYDGPHLAFKQTLLLARKRSTPAENIDAEEWNKTWFEDLRVMPSEPDGDRYDVPLGQPPMLFSAGQLREEDIAELLERSPLSRRMEVPSLRGCGRPPLPLKQGHLAQALASGMMNGVVGSGPTLHVCKGTVIRQTFRDHFRDETGDGRAAMIERDTNTFSIKVRALRPSGVIHDMIGEIEREDDTDG